MDLIESINALRDKGIKVEVSFEKNSILKFIIWGALAAVLAGTLTSVFKKFIG
jgi:hypothetical protein